MYEVSKCWDIALQQAKPGTTIKVTCPGYLDKGQKSPEQHTKIITPEAEASTIDPKKTVVYEFDVEECGPEPEYLKPSMQNGMLKDN